LWFLLRLYVEARSSGNWLRVNELREHFVQTKHLRMLVSRAFADFATWGVKVGWGTDMRRDPSLLPIAARNRGPFWLAPGEVSRLQVRIGSKVASEAQIEQWLALKRSAAVTQAGDPPRTAAAALNPAFLQCWAEGRKRMLQGQLTGGELGALSSYRRAQALAPDPWSRALSLLQQAMVWRRAGNSEGALHVLDQLDSQWRDCALPQQGWLGAMAAIVRAWCAYAGRDAQAAREILAAAQRDSRWTGLFEHHPRVRSECANLQASIARALALDESLSLPERKLQAQVALAQFHSALACASEAELFDAAASAASNLGWSLWLFQRTALLEDAARTEHPLTWIALAAWLGERFGVVGGCWNSIYLLRILRDGGPQTPHPELRDFKRWPVPALKDCIDLTQVPGWKWPEDSGLQFVRRLANDVATSRLQIDALQSANLALELAWFEAHSGDPNRSALARETLRKRLRELSPRDRVYFRTQMRTLPI
jgi:hypothetical protein